MSIHPDRKLLIAAAVVGIPALLLAGIFTRDMSSSFDSVRYLNVAHWLAAGDGVATSLTVVPVQEGTRDLGAGLHAFTIQPPGLPLFYALAGVAHYRASHAALHLVCYLALAWVVLGLGRQLTGRTEVGLVAALLTILSPALLLTVENLWTDLPTETLLLGALYFVIRSRRTRGRAWVWLVGASILAALAVSLRLTALAFGAVLVADLVLSRQRPVREKALRFVSGAGIFGGVALAILIRNRMLAGAFSGTAPRTWPLAPDFDLARAAAYLGSRLLQGLTPGWGVAKVADQAAAANAGDGIWVWPGMLLVALLGAAVAVVVLRRRRALAWPAPMAGDDGARVLTGTLFVASFVVLWLPAARHADFRVVEFRYLVSLLPLVWLTVVPLVMGARGRVVNWSLAAALVLVFAAGVPGLHKPYHNTHARMRLGLAWLRATVPPTTPILSNGGKVLLDEDITRRVYHLSDWNFRHALGRDLRTDAGLLQYLRANHIGYVALFGPPDRHKAVYWGKPIIGLFLEQRGTPWLVYRDRFLKVYRIPPDGPLPTEP